MNGHPVQPSPAALARDCAARGDALFLEGQFAAALALFEESIRLQPLEPDYHYRVASAAWKLDRPALVERHYLEATRLDPGFVDAHLRLAQWFHRQQDLIRAEHHSAGAMKLDPHHPDTLITHGTVLIAMGQTDAAWTLLKPLIDAGLTDRHLASAYAELAPKLDRDGNVATAIDSGTLSPVLGGEGWGEGPFGKVRPLTSGPSPQPSPPSTGEREPEPEKRKEQAPQNDRRHRVGHRDQALSLVERALSETNLSDDGQSHLHFAAAALLDSLGRYDDAFSHAARANALARRPFSRAEYSDWTTSNIQYFTKEQLQSLPRAAPGKQRPIFIVGMPRSGTSLIEQILATHPAVYGAGELKLLAEIGQSIASPPHYQLHAFFPADANRLADAYLNGIARLNRSLPPRVTDKMPANFKLLWLIELILPGSFIIHCTRDPRDTCLSCYFTDFAEANAFSFDLGDLASYYRDYDRLMAHWKATLTLPILDVAYEDVVADPEVQTRRLLEFVDLPWDDRCLKFHTNPRHVATASRDQVRQPLYATSVGRWKNYERHLGELLKGLGIEDAAAKSDIRMRPGRASS